MKAKFIFTVAVCLLFASSAIAQQKYEYAVVSQHSIEGLIISIEGKPYSYEPFPKDKESRIVYEQDFSKLFEKIKIMQDEGWEVFDTEFRTTMALTFILRKKR